MAIAAERGQRDGWGLGNEKKGKGVWEGGRAATSRRTATPHPCCRIVHING